MRANGLRDEPQPTKDDLGSYLTEGQRLALSR